MSRGRIRILTGHHFRLIKTIVLAAAAVPLRFLDCVASPLIVVIVFFCIQRSDWIFNFEMLFTLKCPEVGLDFLCPEVGLDFIL